MSGFEEFVVVILDSIAHGPFFDEQLLYEHTGFEKFSFEQMIYNIKKGTITFTSSNLKNCDLTLFEMVTKSLALLVKFPYDHDNELLSATGCSKQKLHDVLNQIWGKDVTIEEYYEILNQ